MENKIFAYKAIETRYLGPTNFRGSRCKASDGDNSIIVEWSSDLDSIDNHHAAALKLCAKLGWKGNLCAGGTKKGYVFVFTERDFKSEPVKAA